MADEARIACCFATLVQEFPDLAAGSYPRSSDCLAISLEAKDAEQVSVAVQRFRTLLDEHADPEVSAEACIVAVDANLDSLGTGAGCAG
jgi:hypothetical protein